MSVQYYVFCTCGHRMQVEEKHFGLVGKCTRCGKPVAINRASTVPAGAEPTAAPVGGAAPGAGQAAGRRQAVALDRKTAWSLGQVILGEYVVERKLGEGGMGAVYLLARNNSTSHQFAVKKMRFRDEVSRRRFVAELQTWVDMPEHPNLAACHFFKEVDGEVVVFTEYVEGRTLSSWIAEGKLTRLHQILDVAIQSAWGLHAAHELGLVHQDMKPGNVFMTADGTAKLTDLGLARAWERTGEAPVPTPGATPLVGNAPNILVGGSGTTPAYCSPEQAAGLPLTRKTDVWSWGATLLEMFEAYLASGPTGDGLSAIPPAVTEILRKCFQTEPDKRWTAMLDAAEALENVYHELVGRAYSRPTPDFPHAFDRAMVKRDRWQAHPGVAWNDPRDYLKQALRESGRDPAEAAALFPRRNGGRKAQAMADMAAYEEARRIFENLIREGRKDLEARLAALYVNKAIVHRSTDDSPGALELYDQAIAIYERLVNRENRRELANHLARTYMMKAIAMWMLGDSRAALALYDQSIALQEQLVNREKRWELANHLAKTYMNKAVTIWTLGDSRAAVALYDKAIAVQEWLVHREGWRELAGDLARTYQNKAVTIWALGDSRKAVALYDKALAIYERLVHREGREELADYLERTYKNRAIALSRLKNSRGSGSALQPSHSSS